MGRKNFPTQEKGKTQDRVAARVGMSGQTYGRAKSVVEVSECESFHSFYAVPFAPSPPVLHVLIREMVTIG